MVGFNSDPRPETASCLEGARKYVYGAECQLALGSKHGKQDIHSSQSLGHVA